ncbi:hypothetical protein OSTOST_21226, partial [Ostertagia ostertagi]
DSLISDLSSVSHRKPDYARRCILVLLIHAVFILAVFLAFLIGHWLSEQNATPNTTSNELIYIITSPPSTTNQPYQADDTLQPRRNFTLMDVQPPAYESYEFMEELHARQGKSKEDEKGSIPKTLRREDQKKLARIVLKERLKRGRYLLEIEYNITICDQEGGVHCYYEMDSANTSAVVSFTTKFEPTMARSFVPCWDDPGIKVHNLTDFYKRILRLDLLMS